MGAERRLVEIAEEAAAIHRQFPELRGRNEVLSGGHVPSPFGRKRVAPVRRRRTMSAEARKRISEAQKARWAKQKRGK
jgi:hypothetical protein